MASLQQQQQSSSSISNDDSLSPAQIGILGLNSMSYKLPNDLSVVVQRNVQSTYFTTQSASPGNTLIAICNTGSSFVNLKQSNLVLDIQNNSTSGTTGSNGWWGASGGSAANVISRIQIIARNGTVIETIINANQLAAVKVNYKYDSNWRKTVGSLMGIAKSSSVYSPGFTVTNAGLPQTFGPFTYTDAAVNDAAVLGWASGNTSTGLGGTTLRFVIPLYVFSTFCDSLNSLCPAQLLSGARFEILLESAANAMMDVDSAGISAGSGSKMLNYQIVGCRLDFESYLLTDSVMRTLNQEASARGLEVVSATSSNTQSNRLTGSLNVDVAKSCSRALSLIYKERPAFGAGALAAGYGGGSLFDHMASAVIVNNGISSTYTNYPTEYQVRCGQLFFPQSSLRQGNAAAVGGCDNDLYTQTLRAFQKLNVGQNGENASCDTSLWDFRGTIGAAASTPTNLTYQGGRACFALDLQRSAILTSGIPLANSRNASISYTAAFSQTTSFVYLVDIFLQYEILVRAFNSQCVLEV